MLVLIPWSSFKNTLNFFIFHLVFLLLHLFLVIIIIIIISSSSSSSSSTSSSIIITHVEGFSRDLVLS